MKQEGYIQAFHDWIQRNKPTLNANKIRVQVPEMITQSGTHADFFSETGEATVEVWDYGFSEFHVADLRSTDLGVNDQVEVTHHEFQSEGELFSALDSLVRQMSPAQEWGIVSRTPTAVGRV